MSLTGGFCIFPVGVVLRNRAVEHNMGMFSELPLGVRWQGKLTVLTPMVDNPAEWLMSVHEIGIVCMQLGARNIE